MKENALLILFNALTDEQKREFLSAAGVKTGTRKKEKVFVAQRLQTKDTAPHANKQRKAGELTPLTEKALMATLKTWCKGADADEKIAKALGELAKGNEVAFASFKLQPITE